MVCRTQRGFAWRILRRVSTTLFYTSDATSNTHPRDALAKAKPVPGGFHCVPNKESADQLFHDLTINGAIVWTDGIE